MQKVLFFALFVLALVSAQPATPPPPRAPRAPREWWINTKALILKSGTFNDFVGKDKIVVVQFLAQFSNDCKALLPEWDKLALMYNSTTPKRDDVVIALIDGWTSNSVSQSYGITTFPSIMIFNKGDAQTQTKYTGEKNAEKISEWIELFANGQVPPDQPAGSQQADAGQAAGNTAQTQPPPQQQQQQQQNTQPTDTQAQAPPQQAQQAQPQAQAAPQQTPPPVQQTPPPQQQQQQQAPPPQQQQQQQTPPPQQAPAAPQDVNVILNTSLLQAQFDELQRHTSALNDALQRSINDNFQKVENLRVLIETHKQDLTTVGNNVRSYIQKFDEVKQHATNQKDEIHRQVTSHTEQQLVELKDSIQQIRNKVFERKVEEPQSSGFGSGTVLFIVGGLIGAAVTFVAVSAQGNKNRRKLLID